MQSVTRTFYSTAELAEQLPLIISEKGKPKATLVYAHIRYNPEEIRQIFNDNQTDFIGASSAGEFINGEFNEPSIVIHSFFIAGQPFAFFFHEINENAKASSVALGNLAIHQYKDPAVIVFVSGLSNGEEITKGIEEGAGGYIPIYGGLAADDFKFGKTYVFSREGISENGIAALIIDTKIISLYGLIIGGWRPIGIMRTITKSRENIVYTIDNEPALNLVARYSGLKPESFKKGLETLINLATHFQLLVYRENSYPLLRAPMEANYEEGSLVFSGNMPQGSKMQFSLVPTFEVIDNVIEEYTLFKHQMPEPDSVLLFSCKGRQVILGPLVSDEVQRVKDIWNKPLSGFLCYGEIGKSNNGSTEFHNMSCSLLLLKENSTQQ